MSDRQARWVPITHIGGGCYGIALEYDDPRPPDVVTASRVRYPDGATARPGDRIRCAACGANVDLRDLDFRSQFPPPEPLT